MPTVRQVLSALENIAPSRYAFSFDKVGLQVGSPDQEVMRAVVALDRSLGAVEFAKKNSAQLLLTHHPLIFRPIDTVDTRTHVGRTIVELIRSDISFIAAHTNWDSARGGVNDTLADLLDLVNVSDFGAAAEVEKYKLVTFCPRDSLEAVIDSVSAAGAGVIGAYTRCAFVSEGVGTFEAGPDTNPTIGSPGTREEVRETRVEMVLPAYLSNAVIRALRQAHPYEEPAYDLVPLKKDKEQPAGRVGMLPKAMILGELREYVDKNLETRCMAWGNPEKSLLRVAVVGGSADDEWMNAQRAGADVLITGEVKQHVALEASESGMCLIAAGHYATEHPGCEALRKRMAEAVPEVGWSVYTPEPGRSGRPL